MLIFFINNKCDEWLSEIVKLCMQPQGPHRDLNKSVSAVTYSFSFVFQLLQEYFRQQQDIINLKSLVEQKDLRIRRLEEELQRVKFSESSSVVNKQRWRSIPGI